MHSTQLAEQKALAIQRLTAAATRLAERDGLDPALVEALGVTTRVPEVTALRQTEAVAAIMEALIGDEPDEGHVLGVARATGATEATESAATLAAEHDLDLAAITGTGAGGRILKSDVEAALAKDSD